MRNWSKIFINFQVLVSIISIIMGGCTQKSNNSNAEVIAVRENSSESAIVQLQEQKKLANNLTDVDGNIYQTVVIGKQEWMAENLKTTKYSNGESIELPDVNNSEWEFNNTGAYAWYENNIDNKETYGALYNWYAVNNNSRLCPTGWDVPSDEEWNELTNYLIDNYSDIDSNNIGNALKSCRQVSSPLANNCDTSEHPRWNAHLNHFGLDILGFAALPGGYRYYNGAFSSLGFNGYWWTSTEHSDNKSWSRDLGLNYSSLYNYESNKHRGYSVRCVKDI